MYSNPLSLVLHDSADFSPPFTRKALTTAAASLNVLILNTTLPVLHFWSKRKVSQELPNSPAYTYFSRASAELNSHPYCVALSLIDVTVVRDRYVFLNDLSWFAIKDVGAV